MFRTWRRLWSAVARAWRLLMSGNGRLRALAGRGGLLNKSLLALLGRPAAVVAGTLKIMQEMSAIDYVKPGLRAFLLMHGTEDKSVLHSQSVNFQAKLKENKVPCELVTVQGAPHRLCDWEKFDGSYKGTMMGWLGETLDEPPGEVRNRNQEQGWFGFD